MSDLFTFANEQQAAAIDETLPPPVLTVTQLSQLLQGVVEETFSRVQIEAEIGSFKQAASGHMYFNLKDDASVLNAIIWKGTASKLDVAPADGLKVIAHGRITTYPARSNYQIIIDKLEPAGLGALMQQLEERKKKLAAEGLFDEKNKQEIPYLPSRIGLVTSSTGAVIQDILHRLSDRCPRNVVLWPVAVQGRGAKDEIAAAIIGFNALPKNKQPDVIIVARGGGSFEDLMPFNEEAVVRAVAASALPIISGVGHEPDTTLVDYAADRRAPTPSAAAEIAVPVRRDVLLTLNMHQQRLNQILQDFIQTKRHYITLVQRALPDPRREITQARMQLEDRAEHLNKSIKSCMMSAKHHLDLSDKLLQSYAPNAPLKRGYTYLTSSNGMLIRSAHTKAKTATLHFHDGQRDITLNKR